MTPAWPSINRLYSFPSASEMFLRFANLSSSWLLTTGYFANWNRLLPRKLRPVSMEPEMTLSAVMTPITENTPIVTPSIVSAERRRLVLSALIAMRKISANCMSQEQKAESRKQKWSSSPISAFCSLLSAFILCSLLSFIAQRLDRIEPRRRERRSEAGEHSDDRRDDESGHHEADRELH